MTSRFALPGRLGRLAVLVFAIAAAGTAKAETLTIDALYPARDRDAAQVGSLVVERFGGREGRELSFALEGALAEVNVYGQPYFRVVAERSNAPADAILSGIANAQVQNQPVEESRKQCVERDDNDRCIREDQVKINCQRRVVTLNPSLRMARIDDGAIIYQRQIYKSDQLVVCPDRQASRSLPDTISLLVEQVADEVRSDIAPVFRSDAIRVLEGRKGLDKDQSNRFKDALKATFRNPQAACDIWQALDTEVPGQSSIVFNLALCAEQRGELDEAQTRYRQAQTLLPREPAIRAAFDRIAARQAAERDYNAREARLEGAGS
jgi:tetratricopeptide (TPR) repeat protein